MNITDRTTHRESPSLWVGGGTVSRFLTPLSFFSSVPVRLCVKQNRHESVEVLEQYYDN